MKTQNFGQYNVRMRSGELALGYLVSGRSIDTQAASQLDDDIKTTYLFIQALARYRENRENGTDQDNPKNPFPSAGFDTLQLSSASSGKLKGLLMEYWPDWRGRYWWKLTLKDGRVIEDFYWTKDEVRGFPDKQNSRWFIVHHAPSGTKIEGFSLSYVIDEKPSGKDELMCYYRYTECGPIKAWMEEKDKNYLARLEREKQAKQQETVKRQEPRPQAAKQQQKSSSQQVAKGGYMKTESYGKSDIPELNFPPRYYSSDGLSLEGVMLVAEWSFFIGCSALKNYRKNRENGAEMDNPRTPFPSAAFDTLDIENSEAYGSLMYWPDFRGQYWWKLTLEDGRVVDDFYWAKDKVRGFPDKNNKHRYWFIIGHKNGIKMEGFSLEPNYDKGFPDEDDYWYSIKYTACDAIKAWMEEKDKNYLARLERENQAKQQETVKRQEPQQQQSNSSQQVARVVYQIKERGSIKGVVEEKDKNYLTRLEREKQAKQQETVKQQKLRQQTTAWQQQRNSSQQMARALYDWNAEYAGDLSFKKNDVLEIITRGDDSWWTCQLREKRGLVPSNYLEILPSNLARKDESQVKLTNSFRANFPIEGFDDNESEDESFGNELTDDLKKLTVHRSQWKRVKSQDGKDQILGSGSFGITYAGKFLNRKNNQQCDVAIKTIRAREIESETQNSTSLRTTFFNEMRNLSQFCNPTAQNVISFYGVTKHRNNQTQDVRYSLLLEKAEMNLEKFLDEINQKKRRRLGWNEKVKLIRDIANGLREIHTKRIEGSNDMMVHSDIKDSNILLITKSNGQMIAKISDLGISKVRDIATTIGTVQQGERAGTKLWQAPEIILGKEHEWSSDIFSFGLIMWRILHDGKPLSSQTNLTLLPADQIQLNNLYSNEITFRLPISKEVPDMLSDILACCWKIHYIKTGVSNRKNVFARSGEKRSTAVEVVGMLDKSLKKLQLENEYQASSSSKP